jgi:hypothetical protein
MRKKYSELTINERINFKINLSSINSRDNVSLMDLILFFKNNNIAYCKS